MVVTVDGNQNSSHLKQLLVLLPSTSAEDKQASDDETVGGNLEIAKSFSAFVKVSELRKDEKPKVQNIIDERPKRR